MKQIDDLVRTEKCRLMDMLFWVLGWAADRPVLERKKPWLHEHDCSGRGG